MTGESIFALSSPAGGAIAVIRASGPACAAAALSLTGKELCKKPRMMHYAALFHDRRQLDEAMAVFFKGPHSYTGEDMLELTCHGGPAVIQSVLIALAALGLRPAEPGEFTRRAFLNGKLDLSQAEAVMDVIEAEAALSARAALMQLQGRLRTELAKIEDLLRLALSSVSAAIDYPEELESDVYAELPEQMEEASSLITRLIENGKAGCVLREGYRVALLGAPNAGKSSLLNALIGRDRAIVTAEPGTTRDTLEEAGTLSGLPVLFIDTAGLRATTSEAEREGVYRARAAAETADAVLVLFDGSVPLDEGAAFLLQDTARYARILLRTKADLPACWPDSALPEAPLSISVRSGDGLPALLAAIEALAVPSRAALGSAFVTNQRHIDLLCAAKSALDAAAIAFDADCAATDIRDALVALGGITGSEVDEQVVDQIFARFCVGK